MRPNLASIFRTHAALTGACALLFGQLHVASADVDTEKERREIERQESEARRNALDGQPLVRHRKLLVANRLELAILGESTINADFRHIMGAGLKLEYHISDMFSLGALGVYSTAFDTQLIERVRATLPTAQSRQPTDRSPTAAELDAHLNSMPLHAAAYLGFTPWYGKLAAFGRAFLNFDFYFQAGLAYAQLTSDCPTTICSDTAPGQTKTVGGEEVAPDSNPNNDPPLNNGSRYGLYVGGGIHVFLSDFIALDLTVRDYAFTDNPSGADYNADRFVSDDDNRFLHHMFFGLGLSMMFPATAKRTK